jgi:hypothetical protein
LSVLVGGQVDRFWPASGLNCLLHENGNGNGFFDGLFYVYHLSADLETCTLAACIKEYTAGKEESYEGIKNVIESQSHEFDLVDLFAGMDKCHKDLVLKRERLPITSIQED